jgi:hypothetical protein
VSLSCECDFDEPAWYYTVPNDVQPLSTARGRKCCSCGCTLKPGTDVAIITRWRRPNNDIEERIYNDEVPLALWHACETCWGLMLAVEELGMCYTLRENIQQQIKDFRNANK